MYVFKTMPSPVGTITLVASAKGLAAVLWDGEKPSRVRLSPLRRDEADPILCEAERQLAGYFAGQRTTFDLPLDPVGTPFQKQVWQALLAIPFGQLKTYGQIARELGRPQAMRAVGAANGRNPIGIITPCHRVIGASGALTGFAGGLQAKATLLAIEGHDYGEAATAASRDRRATRGPGKTPDLFADL